MLPLTQKDTNKSVFGTAVKQLRARYKRELRAILRRHKSSAITFLFLLAIGVTVFLNWYRVIPLEATGPVVDTAGGASEGEAAEGESS